MKKRLLSLFVVLVMLCALCPVLPTAAAQETATQYFIAPNGNDLNPGTLSAPFKTLARAKAEIRKIGSSQDSDITVFLRGGEYFLDETLWLGRVDSGKNGYTISYRAYPGEHPVINGGSQVTGWEPVDGNIYRAYVGKDKHFTMLSENGEYCDLARTPETGYNTLVNPPGTSSNSSKREGYFKVGDVPQVQDTSNLQIYVWGGGANGDIAWASDIRDIKEINFSTGKFTLESDTTYELGGGSRYYIRGAREFLDSPGEFFMDNNDGFLYYYPRSLPIENQVIVRPLEGNLIEVRGDTFGKVAGNLTFEGVHLINADYGSHGILASYVENIKVKNCIVNNVGGTGIYFKEQIENCRVEGCHIYDIGFAGIEFYGSSSGYYSKNNLITNNLVHNTGKFSGGTAGISLWQTGDTVVSYNTIHTTPRFSICVSSPGDDGPATDYARNLTIEYNDMYNANTDSQDTGVFYTWCASGGGNVVRNNNIHDSNIYFSFGYGLYLDDKADGWQVYNNMVHDLQKESNGVGHLAGAVMVKGIDPYITNNIIANNDNRVIDDGGDMLVTTRTDAAITIQELNPGLPTYNAHIKHNIVAYHTNPNIYRLQVPDTMRGIAESDYNLYYREYTSTWTYDQYRFDGGNAHNPSDWETWISDYGKKYDQHSIVDQDPKFMNMAEQDYRIRYDSPAYQIGFQDINMENMGVREDFPYGNAEGTLRQIYIRDARDTVNRSFSYLGKGETTRLVLSGRTTDGVVANLQNANISFVSSNPSVASITADGTVTALSAGNARITATVQKGTVTKAIAMDILVDARKIVESASAGGTSMDGSVAGQSVSTLSFNFASSMNASTLTKENIKVFVGEEEIDNYSLLSNSGSIAITLPSALSDGESVRVVFTEGVQWSDGTALSYEYGRGITVGRETEYVPVPEDRVVENPNLIYPEISYYSFLNFENEPLGKTPGSSGTAIGGMTFYNWNDTTIATDPQDSSNQVLRIYKPYTAGDMSIDNTKMFEDNKAVTVTTFQTRIYIDELYTEWMIQALSASWGKGNILYFDYTELETPNTDPLKRPIPDVGYLRAHNGDRSEQPIFENTWYTLTITIDTTNQKYSVYIDGEAVFLNYTLPLSGKLRGIRLYNNMSGYRNDSTVYLDDYCVYEGEAQFPRVAGAGETPTPTTTPTAKPTQDPSATEAPPTAVPTAAPTAVPTAVPTAAPTAAPTPVPTPVPTAVPTAAPTPDVTNPYVFVEIDSSSLGNSFDSNLGIQDMEDRTVGTAINQSEPFATFAEDPLWSGNTVFKVEKENGESVTATLPFCNNADWNTQNWSDDSYRKGGTGACYEFKIKVTDWNTKWTLLSSNRYRCFTLCEDGFYSNSDGRLNAYDFEEDTWYRIVFIMTSYNAYNLYIDAPGTEKDQLFTGLGGMNNESRIHGDNVENFKWVNDDTSGASETIAYIDDVCMYKDCTSQATENFILRENPSPIEENPNYGLSGYRVDVLSFFDSEGEIELLSGQTSITAKAMVTSLTEEVDGIMYVALFRSGKLHTFYHVPIFAGLGLTDTKTQDVSVQAGDRVMLFLWKNDGSIEPLHTATTIQ